MRIFAVRRLSVLLLLIFSGCALWRFHSAWSIYDKQYFSEPPFIVKRADGDYIRWRYGSLGFPFFPESKVVNGRLLFALNATTSNVQYPGREDEMPIKSPKKIHALEAGGAFWLEPDGRLLPLKVLSPSAPSDH